MSSCILEILTVIVYKDGQHFLPLSKNYATIPVFPINYPNCGGPFFFCRQHCFIMNPNLLYTSHYNLVCAPPHACATVHNAFTADMSSIFYIKSMLIPDIKIPSSSDAVPFTELDSGESKFIISMKCMKPESMGLNGSLLLFRFYYLLEVIFSKICLRQCTTGCSELWKASHVV